MNPITKMSRLIAELEGSRPKPMRVHLRRLWLWIDVLRHRAAWPIVAGLAGTGAATVLVATFELENQAVPLLTGLFQLGIAAALAWEQLQLEAGD
jgi:hypothetical protein